MLLPIPVTLSTTGLEVSVPFRGHGDGSSELDGESATWLFWGPPTPEPTVKEEDSSSAGVTDLSYPGETGLLLHSGAGGHV